MPAPTTDHTGALSGKVALITGTAGAQGRAAAVLFAQRGARIAGCDLDVAGNEQTAELVRAAGGEMLATAPADISTPAGAQAWVDAAVEAFGRIDVLYNNASAPRFGAPPDITPEDWAFSNQHEIDIVWFATQAAWPHLVAAGGGSIINAGSITSIRGTRSFAQLPHGTAKGAVQAMTLHLAAAGGPHRIRANVILPGLTKGPATDGLFATPEAPGHRIAAENPLGRVGLPEDVAKLAAFLASDDAFYINAAAIPVDGGQSVVS